MASVFPDGELDNAVELGAIDERSVRVWVRFAGHASVSASLESLGRATVSQTLVLSEQSDWTGVIVLSLAEPAPDAPFSVLVNDQRRVGRFAPARGMAASLTFGFGSCHMPYAADESGQIVVREADASIYPAMRSDLQRAGGQLLLLAGDQIYADGLEPFSVRANLPVDGDDPRPLDNLLDRYRRDYRGFFNQRGIRALRENFPTLCIWDDHDIFDNWGSTAEKSPIDHRLFAAACRAYGEYQHSRNPGGGGSDPPFHWLHRWGDIVIMALDLRGARDYDSGTMLGMREWEWLQSWLTGDDAQRVSTLFVMSSVPVAHTARWFTRGFDLVPERFADSIRDRWSSTGFIDSRDALLDALFAWEAVAPNRQVIILSGDVHCASAFTIRQRDGAGVIHQVTSSAMTTRLTLEQMIFNRTVVHGTNLFERRYRFERHFLSLANNYGGIRVEPLPNGGHRIIVAIRSWDAKRGRLRTTGRLILKPEA
ncbi:MAG: alkaline phosphatase family protein [Chloroflexota bacterium]|nr:alkaline phosphatase family protein [Chloroflexota bacterium]